MSYHHIKMDYDNIQAIISNIDKALLTQTSNFEHYVEEEIKAREDYIAKSNTYKREYSKQFLLLLAGEETMDDKKVASTMCDKAAKAKTVELEVDLDIAKGVLDSMQARKRLEEEKMNSIKKLLDARRGLGG